VPGGSPVWGVYTDVTLPSGPAVWLGPTKRLWLGGSTSKVMGSPGRRPPAVRENGVPAGPLGGATARVPVLVPGDPPKTRRRSLPQAGVRARAEASTVAVSRILHGVVGGVRDMAGRARIGRAQQEPRPGRPN
jgi:hypothetical protein